MFNLFTHNESHKISQTDVLVDACCKSKENMRNVDNDIHSNYQKVLIKQNKTKHFLKKR